MKDSKFVDLRSDTVTLPTEEMLNAIKHAKLGDDVYAEDPTVNQLQEKAAEIMGKEAALLVPSGTQANLISLMTNCKRGQMLFLESESHIQCYEAEGISTIAGLQTLPLDSFSGAIDPEELKIAIRPKNSHFPEPALVCLENTHNRHGGTIITSNQIRAIKQVAEAYSLKLYLDGARIFNAAVASGRSVTDFTKHVDNLMFSLSKGLCCPVGSVLVGTAEFIEGARKNRRILGGGMRQSGIIAAPGIIALEKMVTRLKEDHDNAMFLAEKLNNLPAIKIDLGAVQTNIVTFKLESSKITDLVFLQKLKESGILALAQGKNTIRFVTHRGIERADVEKTAAVVESLVEDHKDN